MSKQTDFIPLIFTIGLAILIVFNYWATTVDCAKLCDCGNSYCNCVCFFPLIVAVLDVCFIVSFLVSTTDSDI